MHVESKIIIPPVFRRFQGSCLKLWQSLHWRIRDTWQFQPTGLRELEESSLNHEVASQLWKAEMSKECERIAYNSMGNISLQKYVRSLYSNNVL